MQPCRSIVGAGILSLVLASPFASPLTSWCFGGDLRLRADALDSVYELNLTPDQLHALEKMAAETAAKAPPAAKLGPKLKNALESYCDALIKGDEERIGDLQDKVSDLEDKANLDDPDITTTEAAKKRAADVEALLSVSQLANFVSSRSDEIVGPAETLVDSLDEARGGADDDFKDTSADIVTDVVALAHGNTGDTDKLGEKVSAFLTRVHKLSDADFKTKRHELEQEAKQIVGKVDGFAVLRHWTDRAFAEMLSNPELADAAKAMEPHAAALVKEKEGQK